MIGDTRIASIETADVRAWVAELSKKLAPATVALCYQLLGRIMRAAEEDRFVTRSPCTFGIKLPRMTRSKRADRWLTLDELEHLASCIAPRYRAGILTMGYMGLRLGEYMGLKRDRLDLLRGTLEIAGQLREVKGHSEWVAHPKTAAGLRKRPLPRALSDEFQHHLKEYPGHAEFVFPAVTALLCAERGYAGTLLRPSSSPAWNR